MWLYDKIYYLRGRNHGKKISRAIDSLNLWMDHTIASGKIDKKLLAEYLKENKDREFTAKEAK